MFPLFTLMCFEAKKQDTAMRLQKKQDTAMRLPFLFILRHSPVWKRPVINETGYSCSPREPSLRWKQHRPGRNYKLECQDSWHFFLPWIFQPFCPDRFWFREITSRTKHLEKKISWKKNCAFKHHKNHLAMVHFNFCCPALHAFACGDVRGCWIRPVRM